MESSTKYRVVLLMSDGTKKHSDETFDSVNAAVAYGNEQTKLDASIVAFKWDALEKHHDAS